MDRRLLVFLFLSFSQFSFATIYLVASDPNTGEIAMAYSSSGGNFWQTRIKSKGLIGAQAHGLCQTATPAQFLNQGLSARDVGESLRSQCEQVGWEAYRLAIVTIDGEISTVIAKEGCTNENQTCGELHSSHFTIIGGGLEKGVLEAGRAAFESQGKDVPLRCRLFSALKAVYRAGGEIKDFRGASLSVDAPEFKAIQHWEARGAEATLIPNLEKQLKGENLACESR